MRGRAGGPAVQSAGRLAVAAPAVAALVVAALAGCAALPALPGDAADDSVATLDPPAGAQSARVVRVVDGDTLVLRGIGSGPLEHGRDTKVRVLEIDAPEVSGEPECYGDEATAFAERTLEPGSTVRVEADRDLYDPYQRTLLYVWADDGTFYDEAAVRLGYARAVLFEPNDRHYARLRVAEAAARVEQRGLWGAC